MTIAKNILLAELC